MPFYGGGPVQKEIPDDPNFECHLYTREGYGECWDIMRGVMQAPPSFEVFQFGYRKAPFDVTAEQYAHQISRRN